GRCEIRLISDYPRSLAVRAALLISGLISFLLFLALDRQKRVQPPAAVLIVIFMAFLFAGSVFVGLDSGSSGSGDGNPRPAFSEYPARFARWYQQNLPFRESLYSLHYKFCRHFGISPVKDLIFGEDDWLFVRFASRYGQTPYDDYLGNNLFTPQELQTILGNLTRARDVLKKQNIRFCVFIAPGKLHVYDRMLPEEWRRKPGASTRIRQLVEYIRKNSDIPVEYPLDEFAAYEKKFAVPLYYKHDTHWNFLGAYIGARSLMRLADPAEAARMPDVSSLEYRMAGLHRGDLARMLEAPESFLEPNWKFQHPSFDYSRVPTESGCYSYPGKLPHGKRVFFIRDSFMMGMAPFLAAHFSHLTFYWDFSLNSEMISEDRPDVVVLEIVDRYLSKLKSFNEVTRRLERGGRMM
ncbi:MAG: hypothetical protein J5858_14735, partial [Lentisphaeria bacterium]|nr:hypothetical protein [Lentisphaeria bacterium]